MERKTSSADAKALEDTRALLVVVGRLLVAQKLRRVQKKTGRLPELEDISFWLKHRFRSERMQLLREVGRLVSDPDLRPEEQVLQGLFHVLKLLDEETKPKRGRPKKTRRAPMLAHVNWLHPDPRPRGRPIDPAIRARDHGLQALIAGVKLRLFMDSRRVRAGNEHEITIGLFADRLGANNDLERAIAIAARTALHRDQAWEDMLNDSTERIPDTEAVSEAIRRGLVSGSPASLLARLRRSRSLAPYRRGG